MNHMKQIAKMLNLEWDDKLQESDAFNVPTLHNSPYKITKTGLKNNKDLSASNVLQSILCGNCEIIKLPWMPKYNEAYFVPNIINCSFFNEMCWHNSDLDKKYYKLGFVCKTSEEAKNKAKKIIHWLEQNI